MNQHCLHFYRITWHRHCGQAGFMAQSKKKKVRGKKAESRASWNGNLTFGLVSFPVQAFNAFDRKQGDFHFHQLHAQCHRRIYYQKVCPEHGELSADEIVSGYEYAPDKYVEIEPDELEALTTERERSLTIDTFIEPDAIDPIYLDGRMYYLFPALGAEEPYAVMAEAMDREHRYGVGEIVFSGKEQLAMVRSVAGVLQMAMLNFDEEIRSVTEVGSFKKVRPNSRQVQLAQTLIRHWFKREFDFTRYDDEYRKRVEELIQAKIEGREVVAPPEEEELPDVVNLLDALQRSLGDSSTPKHRSPKRAARQRAGEKPRRRKRASG